MIKMSNLKADMYSHPEGRSMIRCLLGWGWSRAGWESRPLGYQQEHGNSQRNQKSAPSRSLDLISLEKEMTCLKYPLAKSIEIFNVSNRKPKMCLCWTVETLRGRSSAEFSSLASIAFYHSERAMAGSFPWASDGDGDSGDPVRGC